VCERRKWAEGELTKREERLNRLQTFSRREDVGRACYSHPDRRDFGGKTERKGEVPETDVTFRHPSLCNLKRRETRCKTGKLKSSGEKPGGGKRCVKSRAIRRTEGTTDQ